jgi:hypothetical protein
MQPAEFGAVHVVLDEAQQTRPLEAIHSILWRTLYGQRRQLSQGGPDHPVSLLERLPLASRPARRPAPLVRLAQRAAAAFDLELLSHGTDSIPVPARLALPLHLVPASARLIA